MHRNLLPLALLPVLACYPNTREHEDSVTPSDADTDSDSDTDTDADSDTDTDTDSDTDSDADPPPFIDYTTSHGGTMVAITAGTFEMGSADYGPIHTVTLTHEFWIGQTEVTQGQYRAAMGTNPSAFASCGDTCPVDSASWTIAAVYANALSAAEGLEPCYAADGSDLNASFGRYPYVCTGYRLPTEAEWEYAARGDTSFTYAGSDAIDDVAWYFTNSDNTTHPAANKLPNTWGLYDMSGNVWEWTNDWYAAYDSGTAVDPVGPESGTGKVTRGGSWAGGTIYARVVDRYNLGPEQTIYYLGFRLARSAP